MSTPQYAIMRFAKYKGPEISRIEAHNERTKEKYASNPDVDTSRSHLNYHLIQSRNHYRAEAERQIAEAGCRTRSDSVLLVETLISSSPEFFNGKSSKQIKEYFAHALSFLQQHQRPDTFVSAVVHLDEKTPHMHVSFVPLTEDNRVTAKEIIGNKRKLIQWQDDYWRHMVAKYPELERGESASQTGREHIPPRLFKEMTRLTKQREKLEEMLDSINPFNGKSKAKEISLLLDKYIPNVERMHTQLKKYNVALTDTAAENAALKKENASLEAELDAKGRESIEKQLREARLHHEYKQAKALLDRIPMEVLEQVKQEARQPGKQRESR